MDHLCSSAHPFSLRSRVDYWLNWPQPLPSPSFHFSPTDIYWSLSEKFPSGHPFPKVELWREKLTACVHAYVRLIYKWTKKAFISLLSFVLSQAILSFVCSLTLNLFVLSVYFSQNLLFISLHISSLSWPQSPSSALFPTILFHPREAVHPFEPVLQFSLRELLRAETWSMSLQLHLQAGLPPCDRWCLGLR